MTTVEFTVADGVAMLRLNRPEVLNALNRRMIGELWELVPAIQAPEVRVLVITGNGRAFSSGADIREFESWEDKPTSAFRSTVRRFHDYYDFLETLEKPVIAAINGICVGGGVEVALSCDLRVACASARLGFPEWRLGLIPNSGGCSRTMRLIGPGQTKMLIMTGELIDARQAREIGLIEDVYPDAEFAERVAALAQKLATRSPQALGMAKYAIDNALETDRGTGRYIERLAQSVLLRTGDHREGVRSFLEKRDPKFTGD